MNILIPAYKPDERLTSLCETLIAENYNVFVVNDGSGSECDHVFSSLPENVTQLSHDVNKGKGRAMKTGFEYIRLHSEDREGVVVADADGQHLPADIARVRDKLLENPHGLVVGCRAFDGKVPFRSRFGNSLTRGVFAMASGVKLSDTQTGLRGIPFDKLAHMESLKGERYEYEMNMLLDAAQHNIPFIEVKIKTVYLDDNASSHFNVLRDSFKIYAVILKFVFSSFAAFLIDMGMFAFLSIFTANMANPELALLIPQVGARMVSSTCNYLINKNVVFKNNNTKHSFLRYVVLVIFILACSSGLLYVLNILLGVNQYIAKIIVEASLFILSYFAQRLFVFKPTK